MTCENWLFGRRIQFQTDGKNHLAISGEMRNFDLWKKPYLSLTK